MSEQQHGGAPPSRILADLWSVAGGDPAALDRVRLTGADPALPSSFRVGTAAQVAIAATGLAAAEIWRQRTRRTQTVAVDMRHAAVEFRSERYMRIDGKPPGPAWDKIAGIYGTGDGRKVRLHTNFPHHRDGILKLLGCDYDARGRAGRAHEVGGGDIRDGGSRSQAGRHHDALARRVGRAPARPGRRAPAAAGDHQDRRGAARRAACPAGRESARLPDIRVLDLTRVIAGPVCGRALAAHGADVMRVTAPHLPGLPELDIDTGRGKLSAAIDLRATDDRDWLRGLAREAHIFVQGYRPGGLAAQGLLARSAGGDAPRHRRGHAFRLRP